MSSPEPDLERRHVQRVEQVRRRVVERRREEDDASVAGVRRWRPAQASVGKREAGEHRALVVGDLAGGGLVRGGRGAAGGERVGLERLELHRVRAGVRRRVDQPMGQSRDRPRG